MIHFRRDKIFDEISSALDARGEDNISFEDTNKENEKVLCVGAVRAGKISISYPEYDNRDDCCNVSVSFDFYVKEDEGKFDKFIDYLCALCDARSKKETI